MRVNQYSLGIPVCTVDTLLCALLYTTMYSFRYCTLLCTVYSGHITAHFIVNYYIVEFKGHKVHCLSRGRYSVQLNMDRYSVQFTVALCSVIVHCYSHTYAHYRSILEYCYV